MIPRKRRKGASLIELAVLIAAAAILFSVAIVVFNRILAMRRAGQEHLERTVQTARLAEQFRRDVWASNSANLGESPAAQLTLDAPGNRRIEYLIADDGLRRTEFEGQKQQSANTYKIPGADVLRFTEVDASQSKSVALVIALVRETVVVGESTHGKPIRIAAIVGRDRAHGVDEENGND